MEVFVWLLGFCSRNISHFESKVFEFLAISKALGRQADDPEPHRFLHIDTSNFWESFVFSIPKILLRQEAERLAKLLGDKYLEGFTKKYNNIMHGT